MKRTKVVSLTLGLVLLAGATAIQTQAQNANKKTEITFSQPVAVPGMSLPTGKYTFTILDTLSSRNVVQIWNEDRTKLLTTILAINNYRLQPTGETVIEFSERPANQPQAVKAWFYPGDNFGIEFVYPKNEAAQIAKASNEVVPAETADLTPSTLRTVPLIAITPEQKEEPVTEAFETTPTPQPVTVAKELPRTASTNPLVALLGVLCIGIGFGLRRITVKQQ